MLGASVAGVAIASSRSGIIGTALTLGRAFSSSGMAPKADPKAAPAPPGVSEELAAHIKDKGLLKTEGFIGGDWVKASDGATYQVRV
jgi:hypothetical protein